MTTDPLNVQDPSPSWGTGVATTKQHREAAIARTRDAVKAEAAAASAAQPGGPGIHRLAMFKSALNLMETAHGLAGAASSPGGPEETGRSTLAERENDFYKTYAARTGVPVRREERP